MQSLTGLGEFESDWALEQGTTPQTVITLDIFDWFTVYKGVLSFVVNPVQWVGVALDLKKRERSE